MKSRLILVLLMLISTTFFSSSLFAIRIDAMIPAEKTEPGIPMAAIACEDGMAGPYPCNKIDLLAFVPLSSMGCGGSGNVVEGWVDPETQKEYALMGCDNGVSFLDVSDPENPIYLGRLPTQTTSSLWRDIRVYNNRAYVGCDVQCSGHGIQVFDLTRLRDVTNPPVIFNNDAHYNGLSHSHTIFLNQDTGYLYAVGSTGSSCTDGLHMINVQNLIPTFAGCFGDNRYTHEVTCVTYNGPDSTHTGKEICFAANGPDGELVVVDVTNKSAPIELAAKTYPNSTSTYPHQVWLTEDHQYLLLNDEFDESTFGVETQTWLWNITDLDNPIVIGPFDHGTESIDHNLYVKGNHVYESNYSAGLRILDVTDIANGNLEEIAYFDIWPQNDVTDFQGTWDNYPYLPSGIVLVSGIFGAQTAGLFVLQPTLTPDFVISTTESLINACETGEGQTTIDLESRFEYTGTVTMSAGGLPAGASASFNPLNVVVPGSTVLTVTLAGTPAGNYQFTASATDGTISHLLPLTLNVATQTPVAPVLMHPENNAVDQPFVMHFEWEISAGASSHDLQIATDVQFNNVIYTATSPDEHHTATMVLDPQTIYYWHVRANNSCGSSPYSAPFQFTTGVPAKILLVDDDNNDPDVLSYYTTALTTINESYNVWDTAIHTLNVPQDPKHLDEPDASTMANYDVIIWFSGDASGGTGNPKAGPSENTESSLSQYLNAGGCFAIISQDYFNDRGDVVTPFMSNYLGAGTITDNLGQTSVVGAGIFNGIGSINLSYPAGLSNLSDKIIAGTGAQIAFSGNRGTAAISKDGVNYRTVFMGFPLEAIPTATQRRLVMERILGFCEGLNCPEITLDPVSLPQGTVNVEYDQTITSSGGNGTYNYSLLSGSLPPGLTLTSGGVISGTPTTTGTFDFTVRSTDSNGCSGSAGYSITITDEPACLFCDDFGDGTLDPNWTYLKPSWQESAGELVGTPTKRKAIAIAEPAFVGCQNCTIQTSVSVTGGIGSRAWVLAWYIDKRNTMELLIKPENGVWVLKQRSNGVIVSKAKASMPVVAGQSYNVQISYNGAQLEVMVDGSSLITLVPNATVNAGTVGFQSKQTTISIGDINVN